MAIDDNADYGLKGSQVKDLAARVKQAQATANSKAASVNGDGDSWVREASQIHTDTTQSQADEFIFRTTAGSLSISTGEATLAFVGGNTIKSGYADSSISYEWKFGGDGNVSIDKATFETQISTTGNYMFMHNGGDIWTLNGESVTLADYGISVENASETGGLQITYTEPVIGTLTTATPTSFVATGFNQYDATAGYAHVVGEQEYRIDGTYTSLGFTTTVGGTTTPITVDANGKFTPEEDGYVYVSGASGDILIALVWSGSMDSEPYSAYETSTITLPTTDANGNDLPLATYGMPSVGNVYDRMNLMEKVYTQNIGHYTYSAANLETVKAMGVDYEYDLTNIFYVLPEPIQHTLASSVSGSYIANDFGTEEFLSTTVPVRVGVVYGNNLVDKLRNLVDIQSIGAGLALNGSELSALGGGIPTNATFWGASYNATSNTVGGNINLGGNDIHSGAFRPYSNAQRYFGFNGINQPYIKGSDVQVTAISPTASNERTILQVAGTTAGQRIFLRGATDAQTLRVSNITDPVSAQDAATKNYVDTQASALSISEYDNLWSNA